MTKHATKQKGLVLVVVAAVTALVVVRAGGELSSWNCNGQKLVHQVSG